MNNTRKFLFLLLTGLISANVANAKPGKEVFVNAFGAIANDSKDDTAAVHKAMAFCKKNSIKILKFTKGQYDFMQGKGSTYDKSRWAFPLSHYNDLTIDGQGSMLMFHGLQFPAYGKYNKNISIKNFVIDYARQPFSVGKVIAAATDGSSFDIKIEPQYKVHGGERVGAFLEIEPDTGLPVNRGLSVYHRVSSTKLIAPQTLRVQLSAKIPRVKPGMTFSLRHYLYKGALFRIAHSSNIVFENLTAYSGTGMGIVGQYINNITVKNVKIIKNAKRKAIMSNSSDALNFLTCSGKIIVEDCVFDGQCDDGMNVFVNYWTVKRIINPTTIELYNEKAHSHETPEESAGDVFEFLRSDTLQKYDSRKIKTIKPNFKKYSAIVEFTSPLPKTLRIGDDILMKENELTQVLVRNCTFSPIRGRGLTIQVPNVTVENCKFINSSSSGIHISTALSPWFEGGPAKNIMIRNNKFLNCSRIGGGKSSAVIQIGAVLRNRDVAEDLSTTGKYALNGVHRNISIINNQIIKSNNGGIVINAVDGILIKNNTLTDLSIAPDRTWQTKLYWSKNAITMLGVKNMKMINNSYKSTNPAKKKGIIAIGAGCDKKSIVFKDNKGFSVEYKNVLPK